MEQINKKDACLYVDIVCTNCGKLMALSNAYQYKNKYLCPGCIPPLVLEDVDGKPMVFLEKKF